MGAGSWRVGRHLNWKRRRCALNKLGNRSFHGKVGGLYMKISTRMMVGVVLVLTSTISGCFSFRGGDKTVIQQRSPSTEQELADLKAAYDRGIISQQEYNQQRNRLMGR
jgi:hypothetical protein